MSGCKRQVSKACCFDGILAPEGTLQKLGGGLRLLYNARMLRKYGEREFLEVACVRVPFPKLLVNSPNIAADDDSNTNQTSCFQRGQVDR